jgi:two-component system OmpR family sensor kinase
MKARFGQFGSSITFRLIMWLVIGTSVLWCAAVAASVAISYRELNEAFDRVLTEAAGRILPLAADDALEHEQGEAQAMDRFIEGRVAYFSYQLTDTSGRVVLRSHDAPRAPYAQAATAGFTTVGHFRLFTETDPRTGLTITIAETTHERRETILRASEAMVWPLAGLIPLNILTIWLGVRRSMVPVARLSAEIATRSGLRLDPLDTSDLPTELKPIADAVAHLIERLKSALDAERAFAGNSAHELRTPIAGALAQTQRLIAELANPDDRRRVRELEGTLKRLAALAEKLLQLSRVDAGLGLVDHAVDLMPVLDLVVADCRRRLEDPDRIRVTKHPDCALVAPIDLDAFAIALRNLIDNAINHGPVDGPIDVILEPAGVIRVINEGPVVPPEGLTALTHRFIRGETRSLGAGLGLSIVETIMRQSGSRLTLLSPATDRAAGFEARLELVNGQAPIGFSK